MPSDRSSAQPARTIEASGMNRTLLLCLAMVASVATRSQGQESARVLRNGTEATLSVFGPRPVDLAAKTLVDEFRVANNVEDPLYFYSDDVQLSHVAPSGKRVMVPRASLLEMGLANREATTG
jgi:hypothetical protein